MIKDVLADLMFTYKETDIINLMQRIIDLEKRIENLENKEASNGICTR